MYKLMSDGHTCEDNPTPVDDPSFLINTQAIINFTIFGIISLANIIVLIKIKFKIERWAAITILCYFITITTRLIQQISFYGGYISPYSYEIPD